MCETSDDASASLEVWSYGNHQDAATASPLNPGNSVLGLKAESGVIDARLNLRMNIDGAGLVVQPRWLGQTKASDAGAAPTSRLSLRQAFVRLPSSETSTVIAGRQVLAWGPANFRSPSSPFYFDSGKLNPLREVSGIDLARYLRVAEPYSVSAGYVWGDSEHPESGATDSAFAKLDYQASDYVLSANITKTHARKPFIGSYGQFNANDALMLYAEFGHGQRPRSLKVEPTAVPPLQPQAPSDAASSVLAGASYTLLTGQVMSLEYLHDAHGLSGADQDSYFRILRRSADIAMTSPLASAQARQTALLRSVAGQSPGLLGRNYVSMLWQSNPQEPGRYWRLSATLNTHDKSVQWSAYFEKNFSAHFTGLLNLVHNSGPTDSEFRSISRSIVTLGLKAFVF